MSRSTRLSGKRLSALGLALALILTSCGGNGSSGGGRTKNSALCFATQEDKDAAIATAQADLDAANGSETSVPSSDSTVESSDSTVQASSTTVLSSSTTVLSSSTTVLTSDTSVVESEPNIAMLEQALADAQNQPLCDAEGASVEVTYPPEPVSYNTTTQRVTAEQSYDLVIPVGGQWFHAEGFGDDGSCYLDNPGGVWAALVVTDSTGAMVVRDFQTVNAENCIGANITIFLPEGSYLLSASTGDMQCCGSYFDYPLDFNLTFGLADAADTPAPAELPVSDSTTSTTTTEPTSDTLPVEIFGGGGGGTTTSTMVAGTTPAETTLPAVTSEAVVIPQGTHELTCDADCVANLFENFGFADGEITISAGAEEIVINYGDQSAAVKVGTRAKEIKVSAVSASGKKAEASVGVEFAKTQDAPWVAPGTAAEASKSGSSKMIYVYVLIALLVLVAIGYMRRKKATETK